MEGFGYWGGFMRLWSWLAIIMYVIYGKALRLLVHVEFDVCKTSWGLLSSWMAGKDSK